MYRLFRKKSLFGLVILSLVISMAPQIFAAPVQTNTGDNGNVKKGHFAPQSIAPKSFSSQSLQSPNSNSMSATAQGKSRGAYIKSKSQRYAKDRIIVKYKQGISVKDVNVLSNQYGLKTRKNLALTSAQVLDVNPDKIDQAIQALQSSGKVEYAQPDYLILPSDMTAASEPLYPQEWGLKNTGQTVIDPSMGSSQGVSGIDINVEQAWNSGALGDNVIVAVIDTGVDINHPDLINNIWTNPSPNAQMQDIHGYNFYEGNNQLYDPNDGDEHGTHVAGTIAAGVNSLGVTGVAPKVKIMPLKFIGPYGGYTSGAIDAINYAKAHGAKIANNSWGGGSADQALDDAIKNSGMLFVAAAGNDGQNIDFAPHYPASFHENNMVNVAALNNQGKLAYFSNYGVKTVDVAAPGVSILSTVPKKADRGAGIEVTGAVYSGAPAYHAAVQGFGLESFDDPNVAQTIALKELANMGVNPGDKVLLVNDQNMLGSQEAPYNLALYQTALSGYLVNTVNVAPDALGPTAAEMMGYKAVVWFTGSSWGSFQAANLQSKDMQNLTSYFSAGGNLFLSGQDILLGADYHPFVYNLLGTQVLNDAPEVTSVKGVAGTIFDGKKYALDGIAQMFPDVLKVNQSNQNHSVIAKLDLIWPGDVDYSNAYRYFSGTSMAVPHVAGVAALILSQHPSYTTAMLKAVLLQTFKPLPGLNGFIKAPGIVNAGAAAAANPLMDIPGIPLPISGKASGTVESVTNLDNVYSVTLKQGQSLTAKLTGPAAVDFDLYLYDSSAVTVKYSPGMPIYEPKAFSETPGSSNETLFFLAPEDGTYYLDIYAFKGAGAYSLTVQTGAGSGTYEDTAKELMYYGSPVAIADKSSSGGAYKSMDAAGSAVELYFNGSGVKYTAVKNNKMGMARIIIDDNKTYNIDLYSETAQYKQAVFDLSTLKLGSHKIRIEWTGIFSHNVRKSVKLPPTAINIDAIQIVVPAPISAPSKLVGTVNANGYAVLNWTASTSPSVSYIVQRADGVNPTDDSYINSTINPINGVTFTDTVPVANSTFYRVQATNSSGQISTPSNNVALTKLKPPQGLTAIFYATNSMLVSWNPVSDNTIGYILQRAEGAAPAESAWKNISLSSPQNTYYYDSNVLNTRVYSYRIYSVPLGSPQTKSAPNSVVSGPAQITKVEETHAAITYTTTAQWTSESNGKYSGGAAKVTSTANASLQYKFSGNSVNLVFPSGPNRGMAELYLDALDYGPVDLYRDQAGLINQLIITPSGTHTVKLVSLGQKNSLSNGISIGLDTITVGVTAGGVAKNNAKQQVNVIRGK